MARVLAFRVALRSLAGADSLAQSLAQRRPEAALRFAVNPVLMRFRAAPATQSRGRNGTFLVSARLEPVLIREHREARRRIEGHGFRDDRATSG
jgi:hypothetical protein